MNKRQQTNCYNLLHNYKYESNVKEVMKEDKQGGFDLVCGGSGTLFSCRASILKSEE